MNHMKKQKSATFTKKFEDKYINDKKHRRVIDHSHCAGKYRGAAHNIMQFPI